MLKTPISIALFAALAAAGCGGTKTPGASPHEMSETGHAAAAAHEEQEAAGHQAQFNPNAAQSKVHCTRGPKDVTGPCWTDIENPTAEHAAEAEKHRKMAADHRAASQALRDAEARACSGISDADRDTSPFEHKADIAGVRPLTEAEPRGHSSVEKTVGAVVTVRAVPGLTAEWLQRLADCHIARNAALGHVVPEMPTCPLVPKGVTARVTSVGNGFDVAIKADSAEGAQEVLRRAQSLAK